MDEIMEACGLVFANIVLWTIVIIRNKRKKANGKVARNASGWCSHNHHAAMDAHATAAHAAMANHEWAHTIAINSCMPFM